MITYRASPPPDSRAEPLLDQRASAPTRHSSTSSGMSVANRAVMSLALPPSQDSGSRPTLPRLLSCRPLPISALLAIRRGRPGLRGCLLFVLDKQFASVMSTTTTMMMM
jgi:hypothetical protein